MVWYGCENVFQSQEIKDTIKNTHIERYGVSHPMHNEDIFLKVRNNSFNKKEYKMPSGKTMTCQGYEPLCLQELLNEGISEEELFQGMLEMPTIKYEFFGKKHVYHPDIYLPNYKTLIEVKSSWTAINNLDRLISKIMATRNNNFTIQLRIYKNKKGERESFPQVVKIFETHLSRYLSPFLCQNSKMNDLVISYLTSGMAEFPV